MEEQVIIEVLKISAKNTDGSPVNYIISILNSYINRGIYTMTDFKEKEDKADGKIQGNNRKKEAGTPKNENLEELYKKGYR